MYEKQLYSRGIIMRKQICATVPAEAVNAVKKLAESERRNFSNMVSLLLEEALKGRSNKKAA